MCAAIAAEASAQCLTGAALLDHLHSRASAVAGDQHLLQLVQRFLYAAAVPYFRILSTWLTTGALRDNFSEFMIQEQPPPGSLDVKQSGHKGSGQRCSITRGSSDGSSAQPQSDRDEQAHIWHGHFVIRQRDGPDGPVPDVPVLLETVSNSVLQAGAIGQALIWSDKKPSHVDNVLAVGSALLVVSESSALGQEVMLMIAATCAEHCCSSATQEQLHVNPCMSKYHV